MRPSVLARPRLASRLTLNALHAALTAKTDATRLSALLSAWRKQRHPRIADLVDAASEPLVKSAGPLSGASVAARVKTCLRLLTKGDDVDVGRVLATEWPGAWEAALPLVQALAKLDDPRVAKRFAQEVERAQYASLASRTLWRPIFRRLGELRDVRQLEVLKTQSTRAKGDSWKAQMQSIERTALTRLGAVKVPKLTAKDEAALTQLETPHATRRSTDRQKKQSGDELLAAVYANPSDLGLRAVYGDWLTQHGDPRGELIALQLSPPTPKSDARARVLAKKHWASWMGPVADWCCRHTTRAKMPPTFKAGFAWSVHIDQPQYGAEAKLRALFARPEWRTVEVLEAWPYHVVPLHEALAHPNFAQVKVLKFFLPADRLTELANLKPPPRLEEIVVSLDDDVPPPPLEKLPALRRLITHHRSQLPRLEPLLGRYEQVSFDGYRPAEDLTAEDWKVLERSGVGAVDLGTLRVSRERGAKHFVELELRGVFDNASLLERMPATLERFAPQQPRLDGSADAIDALMKTLARFKKLDLSILQTNAAPRVPVQRHTSIELTAMKPLFQAGKLEALLEVLTTGFGAEFDVFDINYNSERQLADAPLKRLTPWAANAKAKTLRLRRAGGETEATVHKDSSFCDFKLPVGDVDRFLAAARSLVALAGAKGVRIAYTEAKGENWKAIEKALRNP